ncbi:hypothetical protein [Paracoccus sp. SM22M-07]|uniref:hypothetical protein n=1 Tax=Paracoccus sp. SM22M-07 TaxID=1520813 RepID=UPI00093099F6|nr:hypothetical protein [Paracoccus sp. SM22M-07]
MCVDPLTLALASAGAPTGGMAGLFSIFGGAGGLGTAAQAASGVVGAASSLANGQAAASAAQASANAQEQAARDLMVQGEEESDRQRRAGAAALSQQKIAMAANGVDLGSAAAIETLDTSRLAIEDDAFAIRKTGTGRANNMFQSAANSRTQGNSAKSQSMFGAASSLLSTGARVGSKYSAWAANRGFA